MHVNDFVKTYPYAYVADREKEGERLLDFYRRIQMQGGEYNIKFERDPDFYNLLDYTSSNHYAFIFGNQDDEIEGCGSLSVRPCYINGKRDFIGYFADGRIIRKNLRKSPFHWSSFVVGFAEKGKSVEGLNGCRYYLCSIVDKNNIARNAFVHKKYQDFGISPVARYRMISIFARMPWKLLNKHSKPKTGLKLNVRIANDSEKDEIRDYLDKQNRRRPFGYVFNEDYCELERRLKVWDGFSMSSFYVARDDSGKILGCFAVFDPKKIRRIAIDKFPLITRIIRFFFRMFGKKIAHEGVPFDILYLTFFEIDHNLNTKEKGDVLNALLDALYESGIMKEYHILTFSDYFIESLYPVVKYNYLIDKTDTTLFQFCAPATDHIFKEEDLKLPPGLEMCLA